MRYLTIAEVLETYQRVMQQTGGLVGIRDLGGHELYPSLAEKAAALGFSLITMITYSPFSNATNSPLTLGEGSGVRSVTKQQIEVTMFATGAGTLGELQGKLKLT